jgi:ferredoxin-thioredoxin reductase catalytic subunit
METKRKKYITEKSVKIDSLMQSVSEFEVGYKPIPINLAKDHEEVKKLTVGTCLRPDLYLDNDDSCVKCGLYDDCSSQIKNLGKKRK